MPRGKPGTKRKELAPTSSPATSKNTQSNASSSTNKGRQMTLTAFCKTRKVERVDNQTTTMAIGTMMNESMMSSDAAVEEESPVKVNIPKSYSASLSIITSSATVLLDTIITPSTKPSEELSAASSPNTSPTLSIVTSDMSNVVEVSTSNSNRLSPVSANDSKSVDDEYDIFNDTTFDQIFSSSATFKSNIDSIYESLREVRETARELVELRKEIALSAELDEQIRIEKEKIAKRQSLSHTENLSKLELILSEDGNAIALDRSLIQPSNDYDGFVSQLKNLTAFEEMRRFYILKLDKCGLIRHHTTQWTKEEIEQELRRVVPKHPASMFEWEKVEIIKKHFNYQCDKCPAEIKTLLFKPISTQEFEKYLGKVGIELDCTKKDTKNECFEFLCAEEMIFVYSRVQRTYCTFVNHLLKRFMETLSKSTHPQSVQQYLPFLISVYMSRHYFRPDNLLHSSSNWYASETFSESQKSFVDSLASHSIVQSPIIIDLIEQVFALYDTASMKSVVTTLLQYFGFEHEASENLVILSENNEMSHENLLQLIKVNCPPLFSCFIQQKPWLHKRYKNIEIVFKTLMLIILAKITNNRKVTTSDILDGMTNHNTANNIKIEESIFLHTMEFIQRLSSICPPQKSKVFPFFYLLDNLISLILCLDLKSIQSCMSKESLSLCEKFSESIHSSLRALLPKIEYNHFFLRFGDIVREIIPLKMSSFKTASKAPPAQQTLSFQTRLRCEREDF
ncbi:hypothetical protein C9374_013265 [Naegleria lovaniensis]|uniref:Uncharacterized protein n=1 Tax=Naegleria lovaniensis TaxID=51637 RepID=A0AA88KV87_NAELO|nr:uncharacterized protein C9374_013265 [Naegleria lovaniensis]KAG2391780.1 hypothetical protein C9374_013265 [Naegleria lovaniensis]